MFTLEEIARLIEALGPTVLEAKRVFPGAIVELGIRKPEIEFGRKAMTSPSDAYPGSDSFGRRRCLNPRPMEVSIDESPADIRLRGQRPRRALRPRKRNSMEASSAPWPTTVTARLRNYPLPVLRQVLRRGRPDP